MDADRARGALGRTQSRTWSSSRSMSRSVSRRVEEVFGGSNATSRRQTINSVEDEEALRWAALERLPTYSRLRTSIIKSIMDNGVHENSNHKVVHKEVDVRNLDDNYRQQLIDKLFRVAEEDNEKFLQKFRNRIDKVGIKLPTVEVRFEHLTIEADCYIGNRALPSLANTVRNIAESALGLIGIRLAEATKLTILRDASGIIKPSRMTLLLGPPSSGKTTLLLALAGKLDPSLKVKGEVTYNGYELEEFVPQKTSAYISQNDVHMGEMTVKETLDFSARCQGVGTRYELLTELARREKDAGFFPEAEIDLFMKILGLDMCRDTIVGDEMRRGISGGQKKRVTTGEMIVGPTKTLFMDEISTGLDSSTTFQIVKCLQQVVHVTDATVFMSLLQPAPETFELFDDIILLSEGQIVYEGPREHVMQFFECCGFRPYAYTSVTQFATLFKRFHAGLHLENELSVPYDKSRSHRAALVFTKYSVPKLQLLKASFDKEWLLIKRNSFVYVFKTVQIVIVAIVASTVFLRTEMHALDEGDGAIYVGAILFSLIINMFNGLSELPFTIQRLPVFYKQRDLLFHPPWVFTLPTFLLRVPISVVESVAWMAVTYYTIGFAPEPSRFFKQFLVIFLIQQTAAGMFRLIASVCRTNVVAYTGGALCVLLVFLLGGFILPKDQIPMWWQWAYWVTPMSYGFNALAVNEMFAPRWMNKLASDNVSSLGVAVLKNFGVFPERKWFWMGVAALSGFTALYNVLFTLALMYLNPLGKPQALISKEAAREMEADQEETKEESRLRTNGFSKMSLPQSLSSTDANYSREMAIQRMSDRSNAIGLSRNESGLEAACGLAPKRGMVLPFTPLAMSFDTVNYFVDMSPEMKEQGVTEDKLQLLREVTGAFRPGVLTALMGVSGAGKTTLMDVLAGRKTGGYIEGDIRISGFPKVQETFARISGYCEQNDIHSPQVTVRESLIYSAFLRLPKEVNQEEKMAIPGVPKIKEKYNTATWMLEVSSVAAEVRLGMDFADHYKLSALYQWNKGLVKELSTPPSGAKDLYFPTQYSQSSWGQFKSCLWKQWWTYWRTPDYNLLRFFFTLAAALLIGTVFWQIGKKRHNSGDLTTIIGAMYSAVLFVGINNCGSVQPLVAVERTVFYRERAAGMYSALPYALAQVITELPYVLVQTVFFSLIVYSMMGFEWAAAKFFWFLFVTYASFLYFTYYGMMTVSITPNHQVASILAAAFYSLFNLFSGFFIPRPKIPKWWSWYYWICPLAWTVYGLIVSQYGDVEDTIKVPGMTSNPTVRWYVQNYYGYEPDFIVPVAGVLVAFAAFFAFMYAYCIRTLNFQMR
ncbi:hypothetical protein RHGRI_025028 [Rhododendron griersonianum]|uniref:ABC transporter domain-containing protein n=1 Tax=Rhododendron griersonianum TaxID=479676 RepID=A0AAV6J9M5_9ERIC|nr:hypothetical protein RHGRI_025028 [Rhododendron griersonianum]